MILQRKINDERKRSYHHFRTANHHFIRITNKALNRFMAIKGFSLSFILSSNKKPLLAVIGKLPAGVPLLYSD